MTTIDRLARYRRIATVLTAHGLGFVADEIGIGYTHVTGHRALAADGPTPAAHLRLALEELGPTFVKLGQLLSTRSDLLPPDYIAELARLQDDAPPVPPDAVRTILAAELGDTATLFAELDVVPLATASLGQAHAGVLADGTRVVVKVRRPEAATLVEEDLDIVTNLAHRAQRRWPAAAGWDVVGLAEDFAASLRAELDYLREAHNAERIATNLAHLDRVHVPRVFWDATTSKVLTLERIDGVKIDDVAELDRRGVDRPEVVRDAIDAISHMVFTDGFFHADPHPGNLFVEQDGRIGLIDFGMVGTIDAAVREDLVDLVIALWHGDADDVARALLAVTSGSAPARLDGFATDVRRFLASYQDVTLADLAIGPLAGRLLSLLRRHRLRLPAELAMLVRMLVMVEAEGVVLDPAFRLSAAMGPHIRRLILTRTSPAALFARAGAAARDAAALGVELPARIRHLLDTLDRGGVEVHLRAAELEPLVGRLEGVGNRLVAGMTVAALITGVGQLIAADRGRRALEHPLLGAGAASLAALGGYLAWTSRRRRT